MFKKLTGRGAKYDSPACRSVMHNIMSKQHPILWSSYLSGRGKDLPYFENDHLSENVSFKKNTKPEVRPDMIDFGGSINSITHSQNGYLMSHNDRFHNNFEIV